MPDRRHRVNLLGHFGLLVDGRAVDLPLTTQRVVAMVALGGNQGRSRLAGRLWPEVTEDRARASLRSALCQVRQIAPDLLVSNGSVHLGSDVSVDSWILDKAGHRVMAGVPNDPTDRNLRRTCERELLPDWEDDWVVPERDRLQQVRLRVLEGLACAAIERGLYGLAIDHCLAALRVDPLRESAHRALIRTHLAEGNPAAALRAYRECVDVLDSEFGIEPTAETNDLVSMVVPAARRPLRWHQMTQGVHSLASALSVMATSVAV